MNASNRSSVNRARILSAVALVTFLVSGFGWHSVTAALSTTRLSVVFADAYGCNTGTSQGMTFTYDDVHRWNTQITTVSNSSGVPANVIKGIIWVESRGMLNARSPLTSSGYYFGLMQIGATSAVPESMKSVTWMCDNAYNQILAGATELINKSTAINSNDWTQVAGAYFGYGTDVNGTTTNAYMQMFFNHATAMSGTTPGSVDWTLPASPTPTPIPYLNYGAGTSITINTSKLNMRTGADTSFTIVRVLTKGTVVTVIAGPTKSGSSYWYQVRLADGATGWISGNYTTGPTPTPTATGTSTGTASPSGTPTITPTAGTTTPTATTNAGVTYKVATKLNLRQSPSTSATVLATLPSGTIVTLLGESLQADGHLWQKIQTGTRTGWVSMKYLSAIPTPTPMATMVPTLSPSPDTVPDNDALFSTGDTVQVIVGTLNLRSNAGTTASILTTVKSGTRGVVLGGPVLIGSDEWYQLRIDGKPDGWVAGRYLLFVSAVSVPTETAIPTETATEFVEPTMTPSPNPPTVTEQPVIEPPTATGTEEPVVEPTLPPPPDTDGDSIEDVLDSCPFVVDTGLDSDGDLIDNACDATPYGDPTIGSENLEASGTEVEG